MNALSALPLLGNSKLSTDQRQVGAIWKRRRSHLPNGDTAKRPIDLPPLHELMLHLSPAIQVTQKLYTQPWPIHAAAIRHATVDGMYGTVSDLDPEISSHMRAILHSPTPKRFAARRSAL